MSKYLSSITGGIVSTLILSIIMFLKAQMGYFPEFNVVADISQIAGVKTTILGWAIHLFLGIIVWGILFALISSWLKGPFFLKGIQFGVILWLLMMIIYMPIMDNGFFASDLGVNITITSLVFNVIYGLFLGLFTGIVQED